MSATGAVQPARAGRRRALGAIGLAIAVGLGTVATASAQVAPGAAEVQAHRGLHAAAWRGDAAAIRTLLAGGANPNGRDGRGRTPLQLARSRGFVEMVRLLESAGAR
jgi:hypothetical protein